MDCDRSNNWICAAGFRTLMPDVSITNFYFTCSKIRFSKLQSYGEFGNGCRMSFLSSCILGLVKSLVWGRRKCVVKCNSLSRMSKMSIARYPSIISVLKADFIKLPISLCGQQSKKQIRIDLRGWEVRKKYIS